MAKKPLFRTDRFPYHLTARSNNKEWFYIPIDEVWKILLEILSRDVMRTQFRIHALVLMSNHLHLIASSADGNIDIPMRYFLREVCRKINRQADRINHVFGGPYRWNVITNTSYFLHCLKYVYRNPVTAGICERVEDYPYSTLNAHHHPELLPFFLYPWKWSCDWLKWGDFKAVKDWLNTPYSPHIYQHLQTGFKHPFFNIPKSRTTRKIPGEIWSDLDSLYELSPLEKEELFRPPY